MIPAVNSFLQDDFMSTEEPSHTYRLDAAQNVINGHSDELEAIKQSVYCILNTERYQYVIYSPNYGIELNDLFGEPTSYVVPELKRRVTEALTWDSRIIHVDDFAVGANAGVISCEFKVHTVHGDIQARTEVKI